MLGWVVDLSILSTNLPGWLTDFVALQATSSFSSRAAMFKEKEKKKKKPQQCFLDATEMPNISQLLAIYQCCQFKAAEISLYQTRRRGCSQLFATQVSDPPSWKGLAESCPFPRPLLGFEHIFNTSWGVGKFWATVFLGPYLSHRLKICKRFLFASRNPLRLLSMPSSPQDTRFGQWGSREMEECRSHHGEWSLHEGQEWCQKRKKGKKAYQLACLLKSRDISLLIRVELF